MRARVLWLAAAVLAVWAVLAPVRLETATLRLDVVASSEGDARLHVPVGRRLRPVGAVYPGDRSETLPLGAGTRTLRFAVPATSAWVRLAVPSGTTISGARIELGPAALRYDLASMRPASEATRLAAAAGGGVRADAAGAPATIVAALPRSTLLMVRHGSLLALALLLVLSVAAALALSVRWQGAASEAASRLRDRARTALPSPAAFAGLVAIATGFYLVELTSFSISVDDEIAAFRTAHEVWIAQGRWSTYLLERFLLPQPVVPFLPTAIFVVASAASYVCLLAACRLRLDGRAYLLFPLFCAFPTWFFIAEFYGNLPGVGLGLGLVGLAAWLLRHAILDREPAPGLPLGRDAIRPLAGIALLVAVAAGFYQSLLLAYATMAVGLVLRDAQRAGTGARRVAVRLAQVAASAAAAALLYALIAKLLVAVFGVEVDYVHVYLNPAQALASPLSKLRDVLGAAVEVYLGSRSVFDVELPTSGVVVGLGLVALATSPPMRAGGARARLARLALGLVLLAVPFALNVVASTGLVPPRALVAVPVAVWFLALLATDHRLVAMRAIALVAAGGAALQIAYVSSLYQASQLLVRQNEYALASDLYRRVAATEPRLAEGREVTVEIFGGRTFPTVYPRPAGSPSVGRSIFEWAGGDPTRMVHYMRLVGFRNVAALDPDERRRRWPRLRERFATMPAWPAPGAVAAFEDLVLIKLGPEPGYPFADDPPAPTR